MDEAENEQAQERGIGLGTIAWVVCALLVIYVLSIGPVAKIYRGRPAKPPAVVLAIYAPLDLLYKRSSFGKRALDWYFKDVWKCKE